MNNDDVQPTLASTTEANAALAKRVVKSNHAYATIGSKTQRGGEVSTASTGMRVTMAGNDLEIACVGDSVRYPDGTESKIVSGAGFAACFLDRPIAIVGSHLENGDIVIASLQGSVQITRYVGDSIPGFLEAGYVPKFAA